jgi:hypothetical protein
VSRHVAVDKGSAHFARPCKPVAAHKSFTHFVSDEDDSQYCAARSLYYSTERWVLCPRQLSKSSA